MKTAIKRALIISAAVLCLLLISSMTAFAAPEEGDFDGSLHYCYDDTTDTLTISGEGPMISVSAYSGFRFSVKHVVIEDGVTALPASAFKEYSALESVYVSGSVKSVGDYAFQYCPKLQSVTLGEGVEEVGKYAMAQYAHNNTLTQINLPDSLKVLGANAFDGSKIKAVNIPVGVKLIPGDLFRNCRELKEITLPEGVTELAENAFRNSYVESVTLPESLKTIGANAFYNCFYLKQITIPANVRVLPEGAFFGCRELDSVNVLGWLERIGPACFSGSGLKLLQITNGALGSVSSDAFYRLNLVVRYNNSIGSAELWNSLRGNTFGAINCSWVHSPACGQTASDSVFWRYENKTLYIEGNGRMVNYVDMVSAGQGRGFRPPWYPLGDTIERIIIGEGVTYVGDYSFDECSRCHSVLFPATVTGLGKSVFNRCDSLNTACFMGNLPVISETTFPYSSGFRPTIYYRQDKSNWENWFTTYMPSHNYTGMSLSGTALPLWICGQQVNISDMAELVRTDSISVRKGVRYAPGSKSLFLDSVTLNAIAGSGTQMQDVSVIYADQDLTIRLDGTPCALTAADSDPSYGIYVTGTLDIVGNGTLSVPAGNCKDYSESCGICAASLKITDATVNAAGGESYLGSYGVNITGAVPELELKNAALNTVGDWSFASFGLNMRGGTVKLDSGSRLYATGQNAAACFGATEPKVLIPETYCSFGGSSADDTNSLELRYNAPNYGYYFINEGQLVQHLWIDTSPTYYDNIYVDGEMLNSMMLSRNEHMRYVPADGSAPATLYLNNVDLGKTTGNSGDKMYNVAAVYAKGDLNIVVSGNNTVTGPNFYDANMSYGIYVEGKLALSGSGTLNAAGGSPIGAPTQKGSYGIWAESFTMSDPNLYVSAVGANVSGAKNYNRSYGIYSADGIDVSEGILTAVAGSCDHSYGIYLNEGQLALSGNVDLTVSGSTYGIRLNDSDTLSGCTDRMLVISRQNPTVPELLAFSAATLKDSKSRHCTILSAGTVSLESGNTVKYRLPDTGYDISVKVIAAQYVHGRMTDMQIADNTLESTDADQYFCFDHKEDAVYRLFITTVTDYVPACRAWTSE